MFRSKVKEAGGSMALGVAPMKATQRHYAVLGLRHGEAVERCIEAFERLDKRYDPRKHPEHVVWAICHQNDLDEALSVIVDSERLSGVAA